MQTGFAFIAAIAFAYSAPAVAQAEEGVALEPGQSAVLTVAGKGEIRVIQRGRGEWTPHDLAAARHLVGQPIPEAPVPEATPLPGAPEGVRVPPVARDVINLRFMSVAGRHTLLIVENGYAGALRYRARMTRDGQTRPTDVCVVLPSNRSYEHWPHPIDRIELSDFALVTWNEGDTPACE